MNTIKVASIVVAPLLITSLFLIGVTASLYDPWYDFDDDGDIDIFDIVDIAARYGTTGTPINKTALLLELAARIDALNTTIMELQAQTTCVVESGEFDGEVSADMVEDSGANTVINFQNPFMTTEKPDMIISVVLKLAANGLTEGSAIRVVEDIKGAAGYWTGFDLTVSKYSDGSSISDTTQVYVTWIAIGPANASTTQPMHCAGIDDLTVDSSSQVTITFSGVTFTNASKIKLAASGIVTTASTGRGYPARITGVSITTTGATLTLEGWNGSAYTNLAQDDIVEVSWTAVEN